VFREKVESIPQLRILINGREYTQLNGLETVINEGDTIAFLPPIAGG
jgi:molybdopterin converting factor small subunit